MSRKRLAICTKDRMYQERLVQCLMNHYKDMYEINVYEHTEELLRHWESPAEFCDGYILGQEIPEQIEVPESVLQHSVILTEENKYREVYKLMEDVGNHMRDFYGMYQTDMPGCVIAVASLSLPHMQLPYAALLARISGENAKSILIDMQENSGFLDAREGCDTLGLEEIMTMLAAGDYSKNRLVAAIGQGENWDYLYPVQNTRCLRELSGEMVKLLVEKLQQDLGYRYVIFNMGEGQLQEEAILLQCQRVQLLCCIGLPEGRRECSYLEEWKRKERRDVSNRICRTEISTNYNTGLRWKQLSDQWKWQQTGDIARKLIQEASDCG